MQPEFPAVMKGEKFRPIKEDSTYWVSNKGRLFRVKPGRKVRQLKTKTCSGYHKVYYYGSPKPRFLWVHRLVLEAFGPPMPVDKPYALHRNDNKDNNTIKNLYWGDNKQNAKDALRNGRKPIGERVGTSELTEADVLKIIDRLKAGEPQTVIARDYGQTSASISLIKNGKNWRHLTGGPVRAKGFVPGTQSKILAGSKRRPGKTGYRGVVKKSKNRWAGQVRYNQQHIYLGTFCSSEDAARAVNEAYRKYWPDVPIPNPTVEH